MYGRERLGPWWGYIAGWCFVIGKTASCAAMALTFAAYAAPDGWQRPVAALAVALLATVNYHGVSRTAKLTRIIVSIVLLALATAVVAAIAAGDPQWPQVNPFGGEMGSWYGILQSAGLLFFAFAGYARIATMGEEVRACPDNSPCHFPRSGHDDHRLRHCGAHPAGHPRAGGHG